LVAGAQDTAPPWNACRGARGTLGKRCARLDLRQPLDRARFERLISEADLFIHGYRPEALGAPGYGEDIRRALNPRLVDVRLDAYGWSGPWRNRRGFDSLIQMSTGIAAAGRAWRGADKPVSLLVPALDHATGYLMAAAAVCGLALRLSKGQAISASAADGDAPPGDRTESPDPRRRELFGRHRSHGLGRGASRPAACQGRGRADGLDASSLTPGLGASDLGSLSGPLGRPRSPKASDSGRAVERKPQR
jgi:hypothetical protein